MRPFYLKINAQWNSCTDLYPQITLSKSECFLVSHDVMLSVQMYIGFICSYSDHSNIQIIFKKHTNFKDSRMQYIYYLQQISIGFVRAINNHLNSKIYSNSKI